MYFYNTKLLDLEKKGKEESIKFVEKKWTIPYIESGTFAPKTTHQRRVLVGKFK